MNLRAAIGILLPGSPPCLPGIAALAQGTSFNCLGQLTESNNPANGWGALTTNCGVLGTNYAVTNALNSDMRFYRLAKP